LGQFDINGKFFVNYEKLLESVTGALTKALLSAMKNQNSVEEE
jgi:hypothetical protein